MKAKHLLLTIFFMFISYIFPRSITFDDSDPNIMIIDNGSTYEIALFKHSGAFSYIKDKSTGSNLTIGYDYDDLWFVTFLDESRKPPSENIQFSYNWSEGTTTLTLNYVPIINSDRQVNATVTLNASSENYFDLSMTLQNESGMTIKRIAFHNNIALSLGNGDRAIVPTNHMLGSNFFSSRQHMQYEYPSVAGDYIALKIKNSNFCIHTMLNGQDIGSTRLGLAAETDTNFDHNYFLVREYSTWIENGSSWDSPISRFRVDQSISETLNAYRQDNGLNNFPTLQEKLGDKYKEIIESPIMFFAIGENGPRVPFSQLPDYFIDCPNPVIMMLSSYYISGFPGYSPDYLPPDPSFGTTQEFANMVGTFQDQGKVVMPFTIPVWWSVDSPTMNNLGGLTINDIAQIDINGNPHYKDHFGDGYYYVSPSSPFVKQILGEMYSDIFDTYGCDMIYEDVIGGIGPIYDFNTNAQTPISYRQAWREHLYDYRQYPIITENGYDRLAESVMGMLVHYDDGDDWDYNIDDGYRRFYPVSHHIYGDKVIFYPWAGGINKPMIADNLLKGKPFNMAIDDAIEERSLRSPWIPVVHQFNKYVMSRISIKAMTDYVDLSGLATKAVYGDISVIKNWDNATIYTSGSHTLSKNGVIVESNNGDLVAGILDGYNGDNFEGKDHFIIIQTFRDSIIVRHPMGAGTPININIPSTWIESDKIQVFTISDTGLEEISSTISPSYIQFNLNHTVTQNTVLFYKIIYSGVLATNNNYQVPNVIHLNQNYPNPFNPNTTISYSLISENNVIVNIYDISGKLIKTYYRESQPPGIHTLIWDGTDNNGKRVSGGIYFNQLQAGDFIQTIKMVLLK